MAGGSSSNEIKETSQQKAQAEVAMKQWRLYQDTLKPQENLFIKKADKLNDPQQYERAAATSNLGYQSQYGQVRQQQAQQLAAQGVNPADGKFARSLEDIATDQQTGQTDNTTRYQVNQADKYLAGLQQVSALGAGQKDDALRGYSNLADMSLQRASADAQNTMMRRQSQAEGAGTLMGAAGAGALAWAKNGSFNKTPQGSTNYSALAQATRNLPIGNSNWRTL